MIIKEDKNKLRKARAKRQTGIVGTASRPRLCVSRSLTHIYAQLIDDEKGVTIVAFNTLMLKTKEKLTKRQEAKQVGLELAKLALVKKIKECVFDRNGFVYTGRIKELADGAREGGLLF
ncbi:MAG: 50S ribosomal protein L18 [Christensenellaceae bacterium]|jgi:large subunit ribosomal protein L18|nr:50S ribosomal protein L18 [Christensenellaceae bacterium]